MTFQSQRDEQAERTHRGEALEEGPAEGLERSPPLRSYGWSPKAHYGLHRWPANRDGTGSSPTLAGFSLSGLELPKQLQ